MNTNAWVFSTILIVASTSTLATTGAEKAPNWILSQKAEDMWSVLNVATKTVTKSKDPIGDVYGADRWSTASRNRRPMKSAGDVIVMRPGEYPHSRITLTYDVNEGVVRGLKNSDRIRAKDVSWGRDPMTLIRAETPGSVLIRRNAVGGSQTLYLEWADAIRFEGLTFQGGSPMGIGTENPKLSQSEWQGFRDVEFAQCSVRGERDFQTNVGPKNKWGMLSYSLGRSARGDQTPGFLWSGGATPEIPDDWDIEGIHLEHAMYHHNVIAHHADAFAMLIEDLRIRWCGRTAFQMVARTGEGADGQGTVVLRRLEIEDVCLEQGGGGSALTFAGNHNGKALIENVTVRLGANPRLHAAYSKNITGAFVAYAGGGSEGRPTREIVVKDCHFQVGPHFVGEGAARRPNVNIAAVERFSLLGTAIISHAGASAALQIDPDSVGWICLDANNRVVGDCHWGAKQFADPHRDGSGYVRMLDALRGNPKVHIIRDDPEDRRISKGP